MYILDAQKYVLKKNTVRKKGDQKRRTETEAFGTGKKGCTSALASKRQQTHYIRLRMLNKLYVAI